MALVPVEDGKNRQVAMAFSGHHPAPPPGLMTYDEFHDAQWGRMRNLLMDKEGRWPTHERMQFLMNYEYQSYIKRNVKPKPSTFAVSSWGVLTGGQKLHEDQAATLPNLADISKPLPPLPPPKKVMTFKVKDAQKSPRETQKAQDDFDKACKVLEKVIAPLALEPQLANYTAVLMSSDKARVELFLDKSSLRCFAAEELMAPILLFFALKELGNKKIDGLFQHLRQVQDIVGSDALGLLGHTGLYTLLDSLSANFTSARQMFQEFCNFLQENGVQDVQIDADQLKELRSTLTAELQLLDKVPRLVKNPRFTHACFLEMISKVLLIKLNAQGLAALYVRLNSRMSASAPEEWEKDTARIVSRALFATLDRDVFVQFGVRRLSAGNACIILLPKGHVLALVGGRNSPEQAKCSAAEQLMSNIQRALKVT